MKQLIGKVLLDIDEVHTAVSELEEKYGNQIFFWKTEKLIKEVSNYWLEQGKTDETIKKIKNGQQTENIITERNS